MFTRVRLENWKNFRRIDVVLQQRAFFVGPNASGKSNLLDVFRFLRDIAEPQGGFLRAVEERRGGLSQLRSLHARASSDVVVDVTVSIEGTEWRYLLRFNQNRLRRLTVKREQAWREGRVVLNRPDAADLKDESRLTQTYLEQVTANREFRELASFFAQVQYLHLVPQLVREPDRSFGRARDPFGGDFLEQLARTPEKKRNGRLTRITKALRIAVPQLRELELKRDAVGVPHLRGLYEHWRPNAGWQDERQLSDGTLRLLGLLWALQEGRAPLLLEEPELSLHVAVIRHLAPMMARVSRKTGRQTLISTHSVELLSDPGIDPTEVLLLEPTTEGTEARVASSIGVVQELVQGGLPIGEAVLSRTAPQNSDQLSLFGE